MPDVYNLQRNISGSWERLIDINLWTKCNHAVHLSPVGTRRNAIFSFLLHNVIKARILVAKRGIPKPSVLQKSHGEAVAHREQTMGKKSAFTLIKPFQKGESVGFADTWDRVLD